MTRKGAARQAARPSAQPHDASAEKADLIFARVRSFRAAWGQAAGVGLGVLLACATAAARPSYDVRATLSADGDVVSFDEVIVTEPEDVPEGRFTLWLNAERQRVLPASFDEFEAERIFVGEASYGGFDELFVRVEGCPEKPIQLEGEANPHHGRKLTLAVCPEASLPLRIHVRGALRLAHRYGTLGRARNGTHLGDPWYPLLIAPDAPAPPRTKHRVRIASARPRLFVSAKGPVHGEAVSFEVEGVTHAAVFALERGHVEREVIRGIDTSFVLGRPPVPRDPSSPIGDADPFDPDPSAKILGAVRKAIDFGRSLGMAASPVAVPRALSERLVVVEIEERQRLAVALPGILAVSDRAFRLFPLGDIERFHELGLRRRTFALLLDPHLRAIEAERDLPWVRNASAALLFDLSVLAERQPQKSPADLVGFASFHPAVDQLLYAPQVAFRTEYFGQVDGDDPDRQEADRALNPWPRGRFVLEKLRDRLGPDQMGKLLRAHLLEGIPLRDAAARVHGEPLDEFFATWIGEKRRLAYRLGPIRTTKTPEGYEHVVAVERLGDTWIREPVVVELRDEGGKVVRAVWDEAGPSGELVIRTEKELDRVRLDPDGRLQQDSDLSDVHPKWDDATSHPFRPPVFNAFAVNLSFSRARPDALVDFSLRRKYDVREGFGLRLSSSARGYGGSVRYVRGLGPMVDLNSTAASASVGISALRSDTGFAGSDNPVTEVGLSLGLGRDTRRQIFDPATGSSISVGAFIGLDHEDSGENLLALTFSARGQKLFWTSVTNVLALTAGASIAKCPALPHALPSLGSRQILRGYEIDELLGCATAYAIVEDRYSPFRGFYWNAANLAWVRRFQLVPFAAAGTVSSRDTAADLFQRFFAEAGIGLRAHYDYAGVQPAVIAFDIAFPLTRRDDCRSRDGSGRCVAERAPYSVWISFDQTF